MFAVSSYYKTAGVWSLSRIPKCLAGGDNGAISNDNKPAVTPTTSTSTKPAANSGQPQKLTDVNATYNYLMNGEFEVVEVGTHPEEGDVWAEALGAIVRFEHPNDENMPGGIALDIIGASVIKSPSGTTHFTHKADSRHEMADWLFYMEFDADAFFWSCDVCKWYEDRGCNDFIGEYNCNYSIDGNYLTIYREIYPNNKPTRAEDLLVLKKIN